MVRFCILFLAIFFGLGSSLKAQELVVVRAGTLIDVENDKVLKNQAITLRGNKIISIGPWDPNLVTGKIIDWSDYTVLPGLIDGHTHLIGDIQSNDILAPLLTSEAEDGFIGVENARTTLLAGFTSVIDVGSYRAFVDVALRDAINKGTVMGPRMFVSGAYITAPGGGGEVTGLDTDVVIPDIFRKGVASNEAEVRLRVRELINGGADHIKVIATGAVLTMGTEPGEMEFTEVEIKAAVDEAASLGKYVTAHAHGAEGIKSAIRAGVRSIQHGSLMDDEGIKLMKKHGTWLVADIFNGDYINEVGVRDNWPEDIMRKNRDTTDAQRDMFKKAVKAGVNIAFGTDSGVYPHGINARQMSYMVKYGLTSMEAIKSATIWGARAMSKDKDIGSISVGKFADMIAVKGDVIENVSLLENVQAVIKGGALYQPLGRK